MQVRNKKEEKKMKLQLGFPGLNKVSRNGLLLYDFCLFGLFCLILFMFCLIYFILVECTDGLQIWSV